MDGTRTYREGRERMVALGRSLTDAQAAAAVPATPAWTVKDNFAHIAGSAADIAAGNIEGAGTDPWTAAQVDARRDRTLDEVLDEWEVAGPALDELITALGDAMDPRVFIDEWTHEQDVRGALGGPATAGSDAVAEFLDWGGRQAATIWTRRTAKKQLPPLRVLCDGTEYLSHPDDPASTEGTMPTVEVDAFTALRVLVGRRSAAQMAALEWSGTDDPSPWFDAMVVFSIPEVDIHDAR